MFCTRHHAGRVLWRVLTFRALAQPTHPHLNLVGFRVSFSLPPVVRGVCFAKILLHSCFLQPYFFARSLIVFLEVVVALHNEGPCKVGLVQERLVALQKEGPRTT